MSLVIAYTTPKYILAACDSIQLRRYTVLNTASPKFHAVGEPTHSALTANATELFSGSVGDPLQRQSDRFVLSPPLEKLPYPTSVTNETKDMPSRDAYSSLTRQQQKTILLKYLVCEYIPLLRKHAKEWNGEEASAGHRLIWIGGHAFKISPQYYVKPIPDYLFAAIGYPQDSAELILNKFYTSEKDLKKRILKTAKTIIKNSAAIAPPIHIMQKRLFEPQVHELYYLNGRHVSAKKAKNYLV